MAEAVRSARRATPTLSSRKKDSVLLAVVDSGPLYALVDKDDVDHERCLAACKRKDLELVVPALCIAEATYLIEKRMGARVEAQFLRGLASWDIEAPIAADWPRIAELVERYRDLPLGGTDASVAVLAERLGTDVIVTLDRRHFDVLRLGKRKLRLLP